MKKNYIIFGFLLAVFCLNSNIDAKDNSKIPKLTTKTKQIIKSDYSTTDYPAVSIEEKEFINFKDSSLSKLSNIYYYGTTRVPDSNIKEIIQGDMIILSYLDLNYVGVKSYYKLIDDTKGYAHIKNEYNYQAKVLNDEYFIDSPEVFDVIKSLNFTFTEDTYQGTSDLIAGSATNNFHLNNLEYKNEYRQKNNPLEIKKFNYVASDTMTTQSNNVDILRYENMVLKYKTKAYYYRNSIGNIKQSKSYTYIGSLLKGYALSTYNEDDYDVETATQKESKYYEYDSKKRIISYFVLEWDNESYSNLIIEQYRSYYSNNKLKVVDTYKYEDDTPYNSKIKYRSNGLKYSVKYRYFEDGYVSKQVIYKYNKSGILKSGSYKTIVKYKVGKAKSAKRYRYNSKGKIYKSYKVKLSKHLTGWN